MKIPGKKAKAKKYLFFFSKILFSFLIVLYLFSKIEFSGYWHLLLTVKPNYFLLALVFYFLNLLIFAYKWQLLAKMMDLRIKYLVLFKNNLISLFYTLFLPGGFLSGEAVKCYRITRGRDKKFKLVFSVFLDRLTGLMAFIFTGLACFLISGFNDPQIKMVYFILTALVFLIYLFLVNKRLRRSAAGLINRLNARFKFSFIAREEKFIQSRGINRALISGVFFQLSISAGVYFLIKSLGQEISLINLIWINSLVSAVTMIPVSFMGIGLRDFSLVYFLGKFGFGTEFSLSVATLVVLILVIRGLPGGFIELKENIFKRRQ